MNTARTVEITAAAKKRLLRMPAIAACRAFDEALTDGRMTAPRSEMPKSLRIRDLLDWRKSIGRSTDGDGSLSWDTCPFPGDNK